MMNYNMAKILAEKATRKILSKFGRDEQAEAGVFKLVMGVFIAAILVGALIPQAITAVINGRNGSWAPSTLAVYDAVAIFIALSVLAIFAGLAYKAFNE